MTTAFIGARVPLVDPNTGLATPIFYRLLQGFFSNTGAAASANTDAFEIAPLGQALVTQAVAQAEATFEINLLPSPDAMRAELAAAVATAENNVTPALGSLQAEVALLRAAVDDLRKGLVTL